MVKAIAFRAGVIFWILIAVALLLSDWPLGLTTEFASQHQVVTSLSTSVLLLFVGVFVIDAWLEKRDSRVWRRFARVAYRALSQEAKDSRVKLHLYVDGLDPRLLGATADAQKVAEAQSVIRPASIGPDESFETRIESLLDCDPWRKCFVAGLRDMKRDGWEVMTDWAPVMLSNGRLAADLTFVSRLNDSIIELQRAGGSYSTGLHDGKAGDKGSVIGTWRCAIARSLELEEHLRVRAGYEPHNEEMQRSCVFWGVNLSGLSEFTEVID